MMPSTRRLRNKTKDILTPELAAFFERGTVGQNADIFLIGCSRKKTIEKWMEHREKFLEDWKAKKRRGRPWVERQMRKYEKEEAEFKKWQKKEGKHEKNKSV